MSGEILDLWRGALTTAALVGGPFVLAALAVGLLASILQAATQLQENLLSFAPKLIAVALVLALAGHWSLSELGRFFQEAASTVIRIGQEGGR
jgi:flagellar biosynthetic protein FliQ